MKFLLFSDFHYNQEAFMKGTREEMEVILAHAEAEKVDFIIHAGDLCHGPAHVMDFVERYNNFPIPTYHALGNHDCDRNTYEETVRLYGMPNGYYYFDNGGYRMIVCDPNYYLLDGEYIHYSMGNYFAHGAQRDHMPPEQLKWLEETIDSAPYPCILISHESFEREIGGVQNYQAVRDIINSANKKKPYSVLMCINGHHHRDFVRILDNVCYFEINSASFDWVSKAHDHFPEELCRKHKYMGNTVLYNDPLHAIVTIEGTTIKVEGMESSMFMGIRREDTPNSPGDAMGRLVTPRVQSAKITL